MRDVEGLIGSDHNDRLTGDRSDNVLAGGGGHDKLYGLSGDDLLEGGAGHDRLNGGRGVDTLDGGEGNDWLSGGSGGDIFIFSDGAGHDTIMDFSSGSSWGHWHKHHFSSRSADTIVLDIDGIESWDDLSALGRQEGSTTVFDFGNGDELAIRDMHVWQLTASSFEFA